jgi:hypothetical protein
MKKIKLFLISSLCFFLPGCNNNSIDYYESKKHKIDLRSFFNGDIEGWGAIFDFNGQQTRSFYVKLKGTWNGNDGILEEWFDFDDGEKMERRWDIKYSNDTMFIGKAADIIDHAEGKQIGNAVNLHYTLQVPYNDSTINLNMNDWMYLIGKDLVLNRTEMKKFGFKVGEIVLFMKKK